MPFYLLHTEAWKSLWPFPLAVAVLTAITCLCFRRASEWRRLALPVAAFSSLGLTTGFLTGLSRAPAVGTVLPAVLSLLGGVAVILVNQSPAKAKLVSLAILVFAGGLLLGTSWGSSTRQSSDEFANGASALKQRAVIEAQVREYREALELPPWPSAPSRPASANP